MTLARTKTVLAVLSDEANPYAPLNQTSCRRDACVELSTASNWSNPNFFFAQKRSGIPAHHLCIAIYNNIDVWRLVMKMLCKP